MNPFIDLKEMTSIDGEEIRFVKMLKDGIIQVWQSRNDHEYFARVINLIHHEISADELKKAGVWDMLSKAKQDEIGEAIVTVKEMIKEKMAEMRGKRNHKYSSLPKEIVCSCGEKIKPNYSILQKKADLLMIPLVDMIKGIKCRTCSPVKRGRISKDGVITKIGLTCKCGFSITYPSNIIKKMTDKKGISVDELVKGYICQTCRPTRGLGLKGKIKMKKGKV